MRVALRRLGDEVELEVADDGRGLEPQRRDRALAEGHIGLASLTQRLLGAGGSLELESSDGAGTRALARVPADVREP